MDKAERLLRKHVEGEENPKNPETDETSEEGVTPKDAVIFLLKLPFLLIKFALKVINFVWEYAIPLVIFTSLLLLWLTSTGRLDQSTVNRLKELPVVNQLLEFNLNQIVFDFVKETALKGDYSGFFTTTTLELADDLRTDVTFITSPQVTFDCELAVSEEKKQIGLMNRDELANDECMLFVFSEDALVPFWTKNMRFNIDIIFIDKRMRVIKVFHNVPPCASDTCVAYAPNVPYRFVVEINGGLAKKYGIKPQTLVKIAPPQQE